MFCGKEIGLMGKHPFIIINDVLFLEDEGSVVDFLDVDPNLGTLEEWNSLVAQLQQRNIKVGLFRDVKMDVKIFFLVD